MRGRGRWKTKSSETTPHLPRKLTTAFFSPLLFALCPISLHRLYAQIALVTLSYIGRASELGVWAQVRYCQPSS